MSAGLLYILRQGFGVKDALQSPSKHVLAALECV